MSQGFQISESDLLRQSAAVGEASDQMRRARSAVREVTIDTQAYGQLCQFLPGLLSPLFVSASDAMNDATEALEETALKLRGVAAAMEQSDAQAAGEVNRAAGPGLSLPL